MTTCSEFSLKERRSNKAGQTNWCAIQMRLVYRGKLRKNQLRPQRPSFAPTEQESALIDLIYSTSDAQLGSVGTAAAVKIFSDTGLSPQVLAKIWDIANNEDKDGLDRLGVGVSVRLIGYAQQGTPITEELLSRRASVQVSIIAYVLIIGSPAGPLAHITGLTATAADDSNGDDLPPFTEQDKLKFTHVFSNSGPTDGIMSGDFLLRDRVTFLY